VITKETEVNGIPGDSPYAPAGYAELSEGKKALISEDVIGDYLTPKLREKGFQFSESYLNSVLSTLAKMNESNPVADFIKNTAWDGIDRLAELNKILGISDNSLYCSYLRKFFIQAVAMAFNDDDHPQGNEFVLALQGGQGWGKTELGKRMALRHEWFAEGWSYDANNKDTAIAASKVFICELGELDHTLKKEQAALKSFLTSVYDKYRVPYAKKEQKTLRHTAFIATVNDEQFLIDTEGGTRRWAVIRLRKDFHEELFKLKDDFFVQIYAQAYQAYMQGETFRLSHEERIALEAENENVAVPKRGEQELTECLNWEADFSEWRDKSALDIINGAELRGVALKDMSKALRSVEKKDSRVKSRRLGRGWVFFLPPFRRIHGENVYVPTTTESNSNGEYILEPLKKEDNQTTKSTPEFIELYKNLLASYRNNKCKKKFDDYVRDFTTSTLADFLKRPLTYDTAEQIKNDIISYHHIYAA
jgi:predicted P-loop ATPase